MKNEINQTAHSTYRCEYHIVFAPKYRRQIVYGQIKKDIGEIIRKLCREKNVEIIEAEACPNHIHMLVSVPPYLSIAQFVGFLKSKSALMIFDSAGICHKNCALFVKIILSDIFGIVKIYSKNAQSNLSGKISAIFLLCNARAVFLIANFKNGGIFF